VSKAAARATSGPVSDVPVFAGLVGGVGRLPAAVARTSEATITTDATVRDLARRPEGGWNLVVGSADDPRLLQADAVVLATPARPTARLLSDVKVGREILFVNHEFLDVLTRPE